MSALTKTLKLLISYSQRALTPTAYSSLLQQNLKSQSLQQIIHNLHLYQQKVAVFDYNYYINSAYRILDVQNKLKIQEILMILRLGIWHNVKNQMLWKHLQAELYRRLHKTMFPIFEKQKQQVEVGFKKMYQNLQKQSKDHFKVLTQQFISQQASLKSQAQQPNSVQKTEQKTPIAQTSTQNKSVPILKIHKASPAHFSSSMVQILIWYGCSNIRFMNMLLETQLHPQILQKNPQYIISYAQLLTYICQTYMKQYLQNKHRYTARSIKGIYKFQNAYFPQLLSNLKQCISQFNAQQLKHITEVVRSFPVKKRVHRMGIVEIIGEQWKNKGGLVEQSRIKLEEVLNKDIKLIAKFRKMHGIEVKQDLIKIQQKQNIEQQQEQSDQEQQDNIDTQNKNKSQSKVKV